MSARARPLSAAGLAAGLTRAAGFAPAVVGGFSRAFALEMEERRFFLWLPVAAMGGVALNLAADREPALWLPAALLTASLGLAFASRRRALALGFWLAFAALCAGFLSMGLRTQRVATPALDHIRIVKLKGFVAEADPRAIGGRLLIDVVDAGDMPAPLPPRRVRVTTRQSLNVAAGDFVALQARLLPPSHAALPGGYDFARDAFFEGVGAIGSTLGPVTLAPAPGDIGWSRAFFASIDRARNQLALRVNRIVGGDEGAIAAAMVTGKRDFLSSDAKDLIREAGIFHIITISGVQMTLVAGIIFTLTRRALALSPWLALRYPIKAWAALVAMVGSTLYDISTGSRVGTERALIMTLIVLGAVVLNRRPLTMRNLAFACFGIVAFEPEAILGVSFQLSFAAVAALIAVMEARLARVEAGPDPFVPQRGRAREARLFHLLEKPVALLTATLCATSATASFMAYHFHDLSPYVLVGNPMTLAVIEFFAVPGALLGTMLYPLGLDAWVWLYVGQGIRFILWFARLLAEAPGSTLHVRAFAPYALPFLSLGVLSAVLWRSWWFRASAIPFLIVGLIGASHGPRYDVIIAPSGDQVAARDPDGRLFVIGKRYNAFAAEQWFAADADGRDPATTRDTDTLCDRLGCAVELAQGGALSIVLDRAAFAEDCARAALVISPLTAPKFCDGVYDERQLTTTGAVGLTWDGARFVAATDRAATEERPWLPAPRAAQDERVVRPGALAAPAGADPADADDSQ